MSAHVRERPRVCPTCKAINPWIMVQYGRGCGTGAECHPCHLDGWSEIKCRHCGTRVGAWSGRVLRGTFEDGEHEAPYDGAHRAGCKFAKLELALIKGGVG